MNKVVVLINAGGVGSRFGNETPKQYLLLNNKPIIQYSIELFQNNDNIDEIYCICNENYFEYINRLCLNNDFYKFNGCIESNDSANGSRYNGLKYLMGKVNDNDIIIMHDAVRILTKNDTISEIINKTRENKCTVCGQTINANIFLSDREKVYFNENIPSNGVFINSMPFACEYEILKTSFDKAFLENDIINSAGPMGVVAKYSKINEFHKVELDFIETLKITYKEDLKLIEKYYDR